MNPIDFNEHRMNSFLQEYRKEFLYITAYKAKFFKVFEYPSGAFDSAKFCIYTIGYLPIYCVDFVEFKINSFFLQGYKQELFHITAYGVKL